MHVALVTVGLLLSVVVISAVAERLRQPPPVVLAVAGLGVGLVPAVPAVEVDPEILLSIVLPLLLYAAARELPPRALGAEAWTVAFLALGLVLVGAVAVAFTATLIVPALSFALAFTLGAMLGPTDPVAVTALARRLPVPPRMSVIATAESLFNDATGLVLYLVAVGVALSGASFSVAGAAGQFLLLALGGAVTGALVGELSVRARRALADPLLRVTMALVTPLAAYLAAESLHTSGIMAVVVAGVLVSARTMGGSAADEGAPLHPVWETLVFVLEGVVFLLVGLRLAGALRELPGPQLPAVLVQALILTLVLIVVRVVWVAGAHLLSARMPWRRQPPLSRGVRVGLAWTGTRGVVALVAALELPLAYGDGRPFGERSLLVVLTLSVVMLTLLLQGLTLGPLLHRIAARESEPAVGEPLRIP